MIAFFFNTSSHQCLQRGAAGKKKVRYIENKRKNKIQDPKVRNCVIVFNKVQCLRSEIQTPFLFQCMEKQNLSSIF